MHCIQYENKNYLVGVTQDFNVLSAENNSKHLRFTALLSEIIAITIKPIVLISVKTDTAILCNCSLFKLFIGTIQTSSCLERKEEIMNT